MTAAYTGPDLRAQDRRALQAASKVADDKKWVERIEGDRRDLARNMPVTDADIAAAREYLADVHNAEQLRNALGQLRGEVVAEVAARRLIPAIYGSARSVS